MCNIISSIRSAVTLACNIVTRAWEVITLAYNVVTRAYNVVTRAFNVITPIQGFSFVQAHLYVKFALIFAEKIKQRINPLSGEPLADQTELIEEFWLGHTTKLSTLLSLVCIVVCKSCLLSEWHFLC